MAVDGFQHFCRHFSWSVEPQRSVHPSINCASKILLLTYLLTYFHRCCCWNRPSADFIRPSFASSRRRQARLYEQHSSTFPRTNHRSAYIQSWIHFNVFLNLFFLCF